MDQNVEIQMAEPFQLIPHQPSRLLVSAAPSQNVFAEKQVEFQNKLSRNYFDPIHGYFELDDIYWQIIDTEQFQRLRYLKQLGCVNFVFPTATHNRFEHCIGTGHIAKKMMKNIQKKQSYLDIRQRDIYNVSIAGLCHDLGHGPFSHVFDNHFLKTIAPDTTWTHEWASTELLRYLVDHSTDNGEQQPIDLEKQDVNFICDLITGDSNPGYGEKQWMFDIINNKRNSVDVDKWDYIKRDTYMMNLAHGTYDYSLLLKNARVLENQICYPLKHAYEIPKLFQCRYDLYKSIYNHSTVHSVEILLCDILKESQGVLYDFKEILYDPIAYTYLTDNILYEIQLSKDPRLAKAQSLIKRLQKRQFYKFINEAISSDKKFQNITERDIIKYATQDGYGLELKEEDIALRKYSVNFAKGDKDPFEFVRFYNQQTQDEGFKINKKQVTLITPVVFQENIMRIFVKDESKAELAEKAFTNFCKHNGIAPPRKGKDYGKNQFMSQRVIQQSQMN